jgi:hypothetical protein
LCLIEFGALSDCRALKTISIPPLVDKLQYQTFSGCTSLESLIFATPSRLDRFERELFSRCSGLRSICIPSSVKVLGRYCFQECRAILSVGFEPPSMLETIEYAAFARCSGLESFCVPLRIERLEGSLLDDCSSLRSITFEQPTPGIKPRLRVLNTLTHCPIESIDIPDCVEAVQERKIPQGKVAMSFGQQSKLK